MLTSKTTLRSLLRMVDRRWSDTVFQFLNFVYLFVVGDVYASRCTTIFSFHHIDSRDWTLLTRLGGICLYQLSHFSSSDLVSPRSSICYRNVVHLLYMKYEGQVPFRMLTLTPCFCWPLQRSCDGTGAMYFIGCGYNAFPVGSEYADFPHMDDKHKDREIRKFRYIIHAEQNALTFRYEIFLAFFPLKSSRGWLELVFFCCHLSFF